MQKYRVFINRHLISLCDNEKIIQATEDFKFVYEPEASQLKSIIDELLSVNDKQLNYCLQFQSIHEGWKKFRACFKEITAAGGIVFNSKGELLLIHRLGYWDLPKGKLEKNESIEQAAKREVEEECGISGLEIVSTLPATYHVYFYKGERVLKQTHWFKMSYKGDETLIPQLEEAIDEVLWLSKKDLDKVLANTYESLKELLKNAFIK